MSIYLFRPSAYFQAIESEEFLSLFKKSQMVLFYQNLKLFSFTLFLKIQLSQISGER
jgi:hypothetical protein